MLLIIFTVLQIQGQQKRLTIDSISLSQHHKHKSNLPSLNNDQAFIALLASAPVGTVIGVLATGELSFRSIPNGLLGLVGGPVLYIGVVVLAGWYSINGLHGFFLNPHLSHSNEIPHSLENGILPPDLGTIDPEHIPLTWHLTLREDGSVQSIWSNVPYVKDGLNTPKYLNKVFEANFSPIKHFWRARRGLIDLHVSWKPIEPARDSSDENK
ncbi:MAG: hypothetical protein HQ521_20490 [Bacteroidetes bacterium]|nr:hypothetical protein [Bacteroidota bacterium]